MAPSAETFRRFQTKSLDIIDARIKILSQYLIGMLLLFSPLFRLPSPFTLSPSPQYTFFCFFSRFRFIIILSVPLLS